MDWFKFTRTINRALELIRRIINAGMDPEVELERLAKTYPEQPRRSPSTAHLRTPPPERYSETNISTAKDPRRER